MATCLGRGAHGRPLKVGSLAYDFLREAGIGYVDANWAGASQTVTDNNDTRTRAASTSAGNVNNLFNINYANTIISTGQSIFFYNNQRLAGVRVAW